MVDQFPLAVAINLVLLPQDTTMELTQVVGITLRSVITDVFPSSSSSSSSNRFGLLDDLPLLYRLFEFAQMKPFVNDASRTTMTIEWALQLNIIEMKQENLQNANVDSICAFFQPLLRVWENEYWKRFGRAVVSSANVLQQSTLVSNITIASSLSPPLQRQSTLIEYQQLQMERDRLLLDVETLFIDCSIKLDSNRNKLINCNDNIVMKLNQTSTTIAMISRWLLN